MAQDTKQKQKDNVKDTAKDVVEEHVNETPVEKETAKPDKVEEPKEEKSEEKVEKSDEVKQELTDFRVGDTVKVFYKIVEGGKTRIQPYEGIVISKKGPGVSKTFTVRRIGADNIAVERIFPLHSPNISKLEVLRRGKVRRAKLYFLRKKKGRAATRLKERV